MTPGEILACARCGAEASVRIPLQRHSPERAGDPVARWECADTRECSSRAAARELAKDPGLATPAQAAASYPDGMFYMFTVSYPDLVRTVHGVIGPGPGETAVELFARIFASCDPPIPLNATIHASLLMPNNLTRARGGQPPSTSLL